MNKVVIFTDTHNICQMLSGTFVISTEQLLQYETIAQTWRCIS